MQDLLLKNATLVDFDPPTVERGDLLIRGGRIQARGENLKQEEGVQTIDLAGHIVMPGFVCAHTHLYSALACGMGAPPHTPTNFVEILEYVWWRLDRALDMNLVAASAHAGALDALCAGTTTLIDHHASPNAIMGSLECIDQVLDGYGMRRVLCYEVSDRLGQADGLKGVRAHDGLFEARAKRQIDPEKSAVLVGGHASFTMSDDTLKACATLMAEHKSGFHIHVAEAPSDVAHAQEAYGTDLVSRFEDAGLLAPKTIIAHGTHLTREQIERAQTHGTWFVHNPRSNMNNQVGYAQTDAFFPRTGLGTDGIGADMWEETRAAWFKSQDANAQISFEHIRQWIVGSHQLASEQLGVTLGKVKPRAAADLLILDHHPRTPLPSDNLMAHIIFSLGARHVRDVLIAGEFRVRDRQPLHVDVAEVTRTTQREAARLWKAMDDLPDTRIWSPTFR